MTEITDLAEMSRQIVTGRNHYRDATPVPAEQIAPAVALLDRHRPGWREQIDTSRLNETEGWDVLGQLYGPGRPGYAALGIRNGEHATELGFHQPSPRTHEGWLAFWAAWVREIG